jgi:spermidine synthase
MEAHVRPRFSEAVGVMDAGERVRTDQATPITAIFGLTVFVASSLLFVVQPMFARMVLPRLGGSPAVWNTCVLFFQSALLLGYLYAHVSTRWLGARQQMLVHVVVLLLPVFVLPLSAGSGAPAAGESPVFWLLARMTVTVGLPFFVVSTSAPLIQRWFGTLPLASARDPYFLYAASNVGSMLALLSYPFALEPLLGVRMQAIVWSAGYLVFAALIGACMWITRRSGASHTGRPFDLAEETGDIPTAARVRWLALSFVPSSLLLGVTMHISTDIAAVPLLWIVPLAIYLLTFVLAFSSRDVIPQRWVVVACPVFVFVSLIPVLRTQYSWWFLPPHLIAFFCCALGCHRQLSAKRPPVRHLTEFYLWISLGGVLGGVFNTLVAPHIFATVLEYPLMLTAALFLIRGESRRPSISRGLIAGAVALVIACVLALAVLRPDGQFGLVLLAAGSGVSFALLLIIGLPAFRVAAVVVLLLLAGEWFGGGRALFTGRSFFGVIRVIEADDHTYRFLQHGSTVHGRQQPPAASNCEPTTYYSRRGPLGELIASTAPAARTVAVVGLGAGSIACYAESGQHWTFYEIDALVDRVARDPRYFTFMRNSHGQVDVTIADGRIALEQASGAFDLIILDAFSSDAIPVHLLTDEAVQLYFSRLQPNGVVAVHISNRYLQLEPVLAGIAARRGFVAIAKLDSGVTAEDRRQGRVASHWVALARTAAPLEGVRHIAGWRPARVDSRLPLWTDDYSNIVRVANLR